MTISKFEARKELYRRGILPEEDKIVFDELNRRGLLKYKNNINSKQTQEPQIQKSVEEPVQENITYKPMKTVDDINPFYLYSPFYIPFLVLVVFSILIIKKKIKSGWARIGACASIMWTLFWGFYFLLQTPGSPYSHIGHYNSPINEINKNLVGSAFTCIIPFALFFIIYRTVKWIQEGFKEDKND